MSAVDFTRLKELIDINAIEGIEYTKGNKNIEGIMQLIECKATMGENGRLIIPVKIREELHIERGDQVILRLGKNLEIIPVMDTVRQFQKLLKSKNKDSVSLVDSLIKTRRAEAANE